MVKGPPQSILKEKYKKEAEAKRKAEINLQKLENYVDNYIETHKTNKCLNIPLTDELVQLIHEIPVAYFDFDKFKNKYLKAGWSEVYFYNDKDARQEYLIIRV